MREREPEREVPTRNRRPAEEPQPSDAGEERNFEQEVSDINTDPDAGFDFDLNPTDEHKRRTSER